MIKYELSQHAKAVIKERGLQVAWLEQVLDRPTRVMDDAEDTLLKHAVGPIAAMDHRILRVIYMIMLSRYESSPPILTEP